MGIGTGTKALAAFILQASKMQLRKAVMVAQYVETRYDSERTIRRRIGGALKEGAIDEDYRETLLEYLDECLEAWRAAGRIVDERDPSDWCVVGYGSRMKRVHKDSECIRDRGRYRV